MSERAIGQAALVLVCAVWGANFTAMKVLLRRLDPLDVVTLRTTLAALGFALLLAAGRHGRPRFSAAEWRRVALLGLLGVAVFNLATSFGQDVLPASLSSLIVSSSPIFTALLAAGLGVERLTGRVSVALALATGGLALLVLWGQPAGMVVTPAAAVAAVILAVAPAAWAAYTVLSKPLLTRHATMPVAASGAIVGAAFLAPLPLFDPARLDRIVRLDGAGWAAALYSGLISLVGGYLLFNRGLRALPPNEAAMTTYLTPVFGVLIAWVALGERPTPGLVLGGTLILAAVGLATRRRARPDPKAAEQG